MAAIDPDLLLRAYAIGVFPMSDSRDAADVFWVEPRKRAILPLDRFLFDLDKKKRLLKLLEGFSQDYDRVILDAPPGLTETSEQVLRAADVILVPLIPSPLSQRALDEVVGYLDRHKVRRGPVLPIYNMVDRRRSLHRAALEAHPDWPAIPMASAFEAMSAEAGSVGRLRPGSPAAIALLALWTGIEKRIARAERS